MLLGDARAVPVATPILGAKTPISIRYAGSFDLDNRLKPQSTPSSYRYHVEWEYDWPGRWYQLFPSGSTFKGPTPFTRTSVQGLVKVTFRKKADGANLTCTIRVSVDGASPASFSGNVDSSSGTLRLNVEAPTFRGSKLTPQGRNGKEPGCTGGPGVNIFGAPQSFNPLGQGGAVGLKSGGKVRYDRNWKWTSRFASGTRTYVASMRSELSVVIKRGR